MDKINTKPNLFIVGAAKSGTTSLHNYLNQHPDIFMCTPKEPHYLINNEIGQSRILNGVTCKNDYYDLFLDGKKSKYRGESSVMYLMYPEIVIPKINNKFGKDSKVIIMLRNPIDRAYSGYQHVKRFNSNENTLDFKAAWNISEKRYFSNESITPASRYQELGLYFKQVKLYLEKLENVHIIIYDDYLSNIDKEIEKVFDFLGLEHIKVDTNRNYMVGGWEWKNQYIKRYIFGRNSFKRMIRYLFPIKSVRQFLGRLFIKLIKKKVTDISFDDYQMLKLFYKSDVLKLSKLLNRDLKFWIE